LLNAAQLMRSGAAQLDNLQTSSERKRASAFTRQSL